MSMDCNPILAPITGCECRVCRMMRVHGYPERPHPLTVPLLAPPEDHAAPPEDQRAVAARPEKDTPPNLDYYNDCGGW